MTDQNINLNLLTIKELQLIAKHRRLRKYSNLDKSSLVALIGRTTPSPQPTLLDMFIPPITTPILIRSKTIKVKTLKSMAKSVYDNVRKKTSKFADWILGYVQESIKKPISQKVEALKQQVSDIFKEWHPHSF